MKKWLSGILIVILLAGIGTNSYLYYQQSNRLKPDRLVASPR